MKTIPEIEAEIERIKAHGDDGCCCCGDSDDHSPWAHGHSPVNAYFYYLGLAEEQLAKAKGTQMTKRMLGSRIYEAPEPDAPDEIDFDSDEPLACPLDREDGETCESCQ